MLREGLFKDKDERTYSVFEVSTDKFYRMDICKQGSLFHTQPENIIFSIVKKKTTYTYGDASLYQKVKTLKDYMIYWNAEVVKENGWEDGKFVQKALKSDGTQTEFSETVSINGAITKETYVHAGELLYLQVVEMDAEMTIDPINFSLYESVEIKQDGQSADLTEAPYVPYSVLRQRFDLRHIEERDYKFITSVEEGRTYLKRCRERYREFQGIDTETDSKEVNLFSKTKLVGVILSCGDDESRYFPFNHKKASLNLPWEFLKEIEETCQYIDKKAQELEEEYGDDLDDVNDIGVVGLGAHNTKYDDKVFMHAGVDIPIRHDSMQAAIVHRPGVMYSHALKDLTQEIEGNKYIEFEDMFLDPKNVNFGDIDDVDLIRAYGCPDGSNLRTVMRHEYKAIPKNQRFIYRLEAELTHLKAQQEYWGFRIDVANFVKGYENTIYTVKLLSKLIHTLVRNEGLNLNSTVQLGQVLYDQMKCPTVVKTKMGLPSTGAAAIAKLASKKREEPVTIVTQDIYDKNGKKIIKAEDLNNRKYPVTLLIQKYVEYNKLLSAFYNRIIKGSQGAISVTDDEMHLIVDKSAQVRYFFWINQNGAASGRQSSPMHQLPVELKADILPDSDDHYMIDDDYMQVELRLIASLAKEKKLIELCNDPGNDMHRAIACTIQGKEMWAISAEERKRDKSRNFGVVYLISGVGLAAQKYGAGATKEQIKECQDSIDDFYRGCKHIAKYVQDNGKKLKKTGKIETFFHRTRYFPQLLDPDVSSEKVAAYIRQGNNTPVQGTAADIMKYAEVMMNREIKAKGWDKLVDTPQGKFPYVRVMISAHDEVLLSVHKSVPFEEVAIMLRKCMEIKIPEFAALFAPPAIVHNWAGHTDDRYEAPVEFRDELIENYLKTGKSVIENYDDVQSIPEQFKNAIAAYHDRELVGYMEGLIKEYGTNAQDIADHVRHPSLTHDLISRFKQTEEHEREHGKLNHLDSILYATERYLEFRDGKDFKLPETSEDHFEKLEDQMDDKLLAEITGLTDTISYTDADGKVCYYSAEDEPEEDGILPMEEETEEILRRATGETVNIWELFDTILVQCSGLLKSDMDEVIKMFWKDKVDDGDFKINFVVGEQMIPLPFKVDRYDKDAISEFIKHRREINLKKVGA